jgi:hypothetical protein
MGRGAAWTTSTVAKPENTLSRQKIVFNLQLADLPIQKIDLRFARHTTLGMAPSGKPVPIAVSLHPRVPLGHPSLMDRRAGRVRVN